MTESRAGWAVITNAWSGILESVEVFSDRAEAEKMFRMWAKGDGEGQADLTDQIQDNQDEGLYVHDEEKDVEIRLMRCNVHGRIRKR